MSWIMICFTAYLCFHNTLNTNCPMRNAPLFFLLLFCTAPLFAQEFKTVYFGDTEGTDYTANDLAGLPDNGTIIAGTTNAVDTGGFRVLLIRTDSLGEVLWQRTYHQG